MKKNFYIILLILLSSILLVAEEVKSETVMLSLHERFNITENMDLQTATSILEISLDELKHDFKMNPNDPKINKQSLKVLGISPDKIYQYYNLKNFGYDDYTTIEKVCLLKNIPFKKMAEYLEIDPQEVSNRTKTLKDLGVNAQKINELEKRFDDNILDFSSTLTVLGMSVVFISLILTSLLISQLVHLNKKKETKVATTSPIGKISTKNIEDLSSDAVIAVIAAIHKHKIDTDEQNRIMLTWRRANVSMWQASGKVEMPNSTFRTLKNNR